MDAVYIQVYDHKKILIPLFGTRLSFPEMFLLLWENESKKNAQIKNSWPHPAVLFHFVLCFVAVIR